MQFARTLLLVMCISEVYSRYRGCRGGKHRRIRPIITPCRELFKYGNRGVNADNLTHVHLEENSSIAVVTGNRNIAQQSNKNHTLVNKAKSHNLIHINSVASLEHTRLATLNARSIASNLDIIKKTIFDEKIQILALTETWLKKDDEYTPSELCPDGYTILRVDRKDKSGGGVAVMCNEQYKPVLSRSTRYATFEYMIVSLSSSPHFLRIVNVYRPPSSSLANFLTDFTELMEEVALL